MVGVYAALIKYSAIEQFQYRLAVYFWMVGMVAEPVIYLVVWSTVARAQGGSVGGFTPGDFAAYYIVWTLVRNMNIVFTPLGWEWRIREGQLSAQLLRPLHPIHYDLGEFAGGKLVGILLWLPVSAILILVFHPALHRAAAERFGHASAVDRGRSSRGQGRLAGWGAALLGGGGVMDRPRPEPVRVARLAWLFFRVGAMNELQYRVNFVLQIFHSFLALGVGLAVLGLVFSHTTAL